MQALCRLAGIKALPTDAEISQAGCADAGEYVNTLRETDDEKYQELLSRGRCWGSEPSQPMDRCAAHLVSIIIRKVEENGGSSGVRDMDLTAAEANFWVTRYANIGK